MIADVDGHDAEAVGKAIRAARRTRAQPTLICCKTVIGFRRANKQGSKARRMASRWARRKSPPRACHLGWTLPPFEIPEDVRAAWDLRARGRARRERPGRRLFAATSASTRELAANSSAA